MSISPYLVFPGGITALKIAGIVGSKYLEGIRLGEAVIF